MNIGVLTGDGTMYLYIVNKKIKNDEIEEFLSNHIDLSPGNFNWQVLESEQCGSGFVNFRVVEVD